MGDLIDFPKTYHYHTPTEWQYEELLYLLCAVYARRIVIPTMERGGYSVTDRRNDAAVILGDTDEHIPYVSFYYDYETSSPRLAFTAWKAKVNGGYEYRSVYTQIGDRSHIPRRSNRLSGVSQHMWTDFETKCDLEDRLKEIKEHIFVGKKSPGGWEPKTRKDTLLLISQLLYARHLDIGEQIFQTWDTENHRVTMSGPLKEIPPHLI